MSRRGGPSAASVTKPVSTIYAPFATLACVCVTVAAMKIGYARVSRIDQDTALQRDALQEAHCEKVFEDTVSGASRGTERPGLRAALDFARAGDQLVVWRLDRLGRSLPDLIDQVNHLQAHDIQLVSLHENIDTATATGELVFHVFGAMAQFERNLIRERTLAGLTAARARGRKGGRRPKMTQAKLDRAAELMREKRLTVREIARLAGITTNTLYRYLTPDGEPRAGAPILAE